METIAVTSRSFSKNQILRRCLEEKFPRALIKFNDNDLKLDGDELCEFLCDVDKAIIALETIDESILRQIPRLRHISKYGVGLDKIDLEALERNSVTLSHTPGINKRSVAELALSFILQLGSKSYLNTRDMNNRIWQIQKGNLTSGKTIGILGCGNIGKDLSCLLKPFSVNILAHDINPDLEFFEQNGITPVSLDDLLAQSDVISIHLPLTSLTRNLIAERELCKMKQSALLINTSRGGIVNEEDLYHALRLKKIASAATDVFLEEPNIHSPLLDLENFLATSHIGGSTQEAILAMGIAAIDGLVS